MPEVSLPQSREYASSKTIRSLQVQIQVLWALMLHDIKCRFFGNGLGYVVTILWPSAHIAIIVGIFVFGKRPVPYGSSALLYASTGVLPYIAWNYMSRFTMLAITQNKSFLFIPIIKPLDIMFARLALEHVSIYIITVGLLLVNILAGVNVVPLDLFNAVCGLLSAVLLGIGFGILNSVIASIFPLWMLGYVGILLLFWFTTGLALNPEDMPGDVGYYLSWNPLLHSVEWIRKSYYLDFPARLLDKSYVLEWGVGTLAIGLMLEVSLRRYVKI